MFGIVSYIAGGIALLLLLALGLQTYRLTNTERLLAQAQTLTTRLTDNNATLTNNQSVCQKSLADQNAAIEGAAAKVKAANDKATADAAQAAASLRGATQRAAQAQIQLRMFLAEAMASEPTIAACTAALESGRMVDAP